MNNMGDDNAESLSLEQREWGGALYCTHCDTEVGTVDAEGMADGWREETYRCPSCGCETSVSFPPSIEHKPEDDTMHSTEAGDE